MTATIVDEAHWRSEGRRRIVASVLRRHLPAGDHRIFVAGYGSGDLTVLLGQFGTVVGEGEIPVDLPAPEEVDVVAAFEVLDALADDGAALGAIERALPAGGVVVVTAAAFEFLWGPHDDVCERRRRYGRSELRQKLEDAGFVVDLVSYYDTWLFPAVAARAVVRRFRGWQEPRADFRPRSAPVDHALVWLSSAEGSVIGRWSPPAGASIVAVAHKG